ncbi:MAG TPA: SBBP repeat-containing protein, partial [Terriglobia bacterium]|nr:SBBP repeat-containing protein [Terriglobia bacterium]
SEPEGGFGIAIDGNGSAYVTGITISPNFPITPGAFQANFGGEGDAFVAKLNPEGSALAYSTFLGGTSVDLGFKIAVDSSGNAFLTGVTVSTNFPTANPLQPASAGRDDAFVTKLNSSGTGLLYSTYLGGTDEDAGFDIATDVLGNAYVTGTTTSMSFPLSTPLQPTRNGNRDAFVTKLNPNGSTLVYSSYLGGSNLDYGQGIALDSNSNAYVTGRTFSPDFPTSASAAQPLYTGTLNPSFGNSSQAFVAKISEGTALFVPAVVSTSGASNSFFTSELVLTNRGSSQATVDFTYTAAFGGGNGTATDTLAAGEQRVVSDAIAYLRSIGMPIPDSGNRGGTLAVRYSASGGAVTVRTTTFVSGGRAGLAYPGVATALRAPAYLCGLRQNAFDRSNVAVQNLGTEGDSDIVLRLTVISGEPGAPLSKALPDVTLPPGGFVQLNSVLTSEGLSLSNGYVRVERVSGKAPFYAYAVINDQANSDGSFVPPLLEGGLFTVQTLALPVIVETSAFESELVITNLSDSARTIRFQFVADANSTPDSTVRFELSIPARTQQILPGFVQYLRSIGVPGIGPRGASYAGALFATAAQGYFEGLFLGARTSAPGGGGRYGLFYPAVPSAASTTSTWIFGLQQNAETRSNLALVNTGEVDANPITFNIELFDGSTGTKVSAIEGVSLKAKGWTQLVTLLAQHAPGVTQGYARVTRVAGSNPFIAYAVVNDGGQPGERTGDGAFVASSP